MKTGEIAEWARTCRSELMLDHENEVFLKFTFFANDLGYKYASYTLEMPTSVSEPTVVFYANYAPDWVEKFIERHVKHHGAHNAYGKRTIAPLADGDLYKWVSADFQREADANNIEIEWLDTIPGKGRSVARVGLSGRTQPHSAVFNQRTRILVDLVIESMERILIKKHMRTLSVKLSEQERKCMLWALDGKTADVIAQLLHIKKGAVDYMFTNVPNKFERHDGFLATAFFAFNCGMLSEDFIPPSTRN